MQPACNSYSITIHQKAVLPTKYFFNLEKRNFNRKTITYLQTDNNKIVKEEDKILETTEKFYEDLYGSKTTVSQVDFDEFIGDIEIPKLRNEEKSELERLSLWKNVRRC